MISRGRRVVRRMGSVSSFLPNLRRNVASGSVQSKLGVVDFRPLNEQDNVSLDKFKLDQVPIVT